MKNHARLHILTVDVTQKLPLSAFFIHQHTTNLKGRDHSQDVGVDGSIVLEFILGKYGGKVWNGYI